MNNITKMWASLGLAIYSDPSEVPANPEDAIVAFLESNEFPNDRVMMPLILGWLKENSRFVHVERLKNLLGNLTEFQAAVLGVFARKCVRDKDLRWNAIINAVNELNQGMEFPDGDSDTFIAVKGWDPDFKEFGLKFAPINIDTIQKKLRTIDFLVENNTWIKNRILFGTNVRADIATIRELQLAPTAYKAAKIATCSMKTAYKNWSDLEQVNWFSQGKKTSA